MIGISIAAILALSVLYISLFVTISPQFGKSPTKEQKVKYAQTGHYENGIFINEHATVMDIHFLKLMKEMMTGDHNRKPSMNIPVININADSIGHPIPGTAELRWFGHSTFLLFMDGKIILIDPMFGQKPSPHPAIGAKRFSQELPIEIEQLPYIDAVVLSHDHYDHLDYESIQKLKGKTGHFYAPLGVGNHLKSWGVSADAISELDWWESTAFGSILLVCTPSRHFSGRGMFDRSTTLWCSWVFSGNDGKVFFSGDSGYDTHFKEIGDKYGPFDISLLECGQYHNDWKSIHMMPEETVQASIDLQSKLVLPIHWGAFTLSLHDWTDPIERMTKKSEELHLPVTTPKIGERVVIGSETYPVDKWWQEYSESNDQ